jgi:hypothetical protein
MGAITINKSLMISSKQNFPVQFQLADKTEVVVLQAGEGVFDFHLTRLNSEKHNFIWYEATGNIEESYETRFDRWQAEAIDLFKKMQSI